LGVGQLAEKGYMAVCTGTGVEFKGAMGVVFGMGWKVGWMYQMQAQVKRPKGTVLVTATKT
jgi:hypothetical protein